MPLGHFSLLLSWGLCQRHWDSTAVGLGRLEGAAHPMKSENGKGGLAAPRMLSPALQWESQEGRQDWLCAHSQAHLVTLEGRAGEFCPKLSPHQPGITQSCSQSSSKQLGLILLPLSRWEMAFSKQIIYKFPLFFFSPELKTQPI